MPVLKFKVAWNEDTSIERTIELDTKNTFQDFYDVILESMSFDKKFVGQFYTSNRNWKKLRGVSTDVDKNISGAEFLSAKKTPVSALVDSPDQRFLFEYLSKNKTWVFEIEMVGIDKEISSGVRYPSISKVEGLPPSQYSPNVLKSTPGIKEVEEKLDISELDMDITDMENE